MQPRVVICDDTPDMLDLLRMVLHYGGFAVVGEATTGAGALERWEQARADGDVAGVILDHRLPDIPGLEIARQIRQKAPLLTLVLVSAYLTDATRAAAEAIGVQCVDKTAIASIPRLLKDPTG